ncbi:MAG: hypothetical protein Q9217_000187, partial [Psora testacea]
IGRFDPNAPFKFSQKVQTMWSDLDRRDIRPEKRCCLLHQPTRRGTVKYTGTIPSLPGPEGAPWVGIALDEPFGRNDGSVVGGERYFECAAGYGVFVRPERVVIGEFPVMAVEDDDEDEDDLEEI